MAVASPVVLPRDGAGKLDDLTVVKMTPQLGEERVGHLDGRVGHRNAVAQDELLEIAELARTLEFGERHQLRFADAGLSADGRPNVDSIRAADDGGGFDLGERDELRVDGMKPLLRLLHVDGAAKQRAAVRRDRQTVENASVLALRIPE